VKRRTKRRLVRSLLTGAVVALLALLSLLARWQRPDDDTTAAQMAFASAAQACQAKVQPQLQGRVDRWQLIDHDAGPQGVNLVFAADVGGKTTLYSCDAAPSGLTVAVRDAP
jgi:hypothetical protein